MRIFTLASEVPPIKSGVAASVSRIVDGARAAGHEVTVRSYEDAPTIVRDQVRVSSLGFRVRRRELVTYDLLHLHGPAPGLSDAVLLRRLLRSIPIPVVYTHHFTVDGGAVPPLLYRGYARLATHLGRAADVVVTTTPTYADQFRRAGVRHVEVVPWGVDADGSATMPERPNGPLQVLVLGQMRHYKGHLTALEALGGIPDVSLTLAGGGDLEDEIVARASGSLNVTTLIDPSDAEVADCFNSHHIVLLPSTSAVEAFGIVLLEGMARGCVPVASALPGLSDVVGDVGALAIPGDPIDLRRVILSLAADRGALRILAVAAQQRARRFDWARTVQHYLAIYERVAESSQ